MEAPAGGEGEIRSRGPLGYVYVVSVFLSAPFSIPVALRTSNLSLTAASAVQSLGWMLTPAIALAAFLPSIFLDWRAIRALPAQAAAK